MIFSAVSDVCKTKWFDFCSYQSHMEDENDSVHCQRLSCKEESPVAIMVTSVALKPKMLKLNMWGLPQVSVFCAIIQTWSILFWWKKKIVVESHIWICWQRGFSHNCGKTPTTHYSRLGSAIICPAAWRFTGISHAADRGILLCHVFFFDEFISNSSQNWLTC